MYVARYVEVYDLLMRERGKDYAGQAAEVTRLVRQHCPGAASLLDVACGTGLHLPHFDALFDTVVGVDTSEDMLGLARTRVPGLRTHCVDMRRLDLTESFDVVTFLFAIAHLRSVTELETVVRRATRHLTPGGVAVIEPWFAPDEFTCGYVADDLIRRDGGVVFRVSHSRLSPTSRYRVRMVVHVVEADRDGGIRPSTTQVEMSLFTRAQYETAFARAGCVAELVRPSCFEHGLWLARREDSQRA